MWLLWKTVTNINIMFYVDNPYSTSITLSYHPTFPLPGGNHYPELGVSFSYIYLYFYTNLYLRKQWCCCFKWFKISYEDLHIYCSTYVFNSTRLRFIHVEEHTALIHPFSLLYISYFHEYSTITDFSVLDIIIIFNRKIILFWTLSYAFHDIQVD